MKICPTCRRTYEDDGLNFCLEDGSVLTLTSADAAPTVVMNHPRTTSPSPVGGVQTNWTPQNAPAYSMQPKQKSSKAWLWVLGIFAVIILVCGGGFVGFFVYVASVANTNSRVNGTKGTTNSSTTKSNSPTPGNTSPSPSPIETANLQEVDLTDWVKESSVWGTTEFKNGEFLMAAKQKGYYYVLVAPDEYSTERAVTRVTVRNPEDASSSLGYGLIFHSDPTPLTKDLAFLIDAKRKKFRVVRHEPEKETTVTPWTTSTLIKTGSAENVLEVRDKGEKIELYINGQLATTITNKQGPTSGVPGLYAGDGAKIGFRKLEIAK